MTLLQVINDYGNFSHQNTALIWLQDQLYNKNLHGDLGWRFARAYRNNADGSTINLVNVFTFFEELVHQVTAIELLDKELQRTIIDQFLVQYSTAPTLPDRVRLSIPWFPQTDSATGHENRMCFASSVSMIAHSHKTFSDRFRGANADDEYLHFLHDGFGDTTNPDAHVRALQALGLNPVFRTDLNLAQAIELLQQGIALAIGFLHRGSHAAPKGGGHYAAMFGFQQNRNMFYLNDPFGSLHDGYSGNVENGRGVQYSRAILNNRWTADTPGVDSKCGWGLYILP